MSFSRLNINYFRSILPIFSRSLLRSSNPCSKQLRVPTYLNIPKMSVTTTSANLKSKIATFEDVKAVKGNNNVILIDVREPSELQNTGTIPGSINIPLGQVEFALKDMSNEEFRKSYGRDKPSKDFPIIFSCQAGRRGEMAQNTALQLGYTNVRNYAGAWQEWAEKNK